MKNILICFKTFQSGFHILYFLVWCSENEKQKYFSQENPDQKNSGILKHLPLLFCSKIIPYQIQHIYDGCFIWGSLLYWLRKVIETWCKLIIKAKENKRKQIFKAVKSEQLEFELQMGKIKCFLIWFSPWYSDQDSVLQY